VRALVIVAVVVCSGLALADEAPVFVAPKLTEKATPVYPPEALEAGLEASVMLELILDGEGRVTSAKVLAPAGHGFDEAAMEAALRLRFSPGTADGKPVSVKVTYRMTFKLAEKPKPVLTLPPPIRLRGEVAERGTRTPLDGVAIMVTDENGKLLGRADSEGGKFRVALPKELIGKVVVVLAAPDHRTQKFTETLKAKDVLTVRYAISKSTYAQYESTVRSQPTREEIARVSLDGDEIRRIPGTRGDALAAALNLPSVARSPFDLGQLVIRGSQPGESGAFVLGMPIPQVFHFGLGTSTFNSFLLERFDLIPSNFSVRFGRLVGGLIDIVPRAPKTDRWHGDLKLDLYDAHAIAEGPVGKGGLALSFRRSYADAILGLVLPAGSISVAPRYYDYQGILDYPVGGGRFRLVLFGSDDALVLINKDPPDGDPSLRGQFGTHLLFHTLIGSYVKKTSRLEVDVSAQVGYQHQDANIGLAANFDLDVIVADVRAELKYKLTKTLKLVAGLDLQMDYFWVAVDAPAPNTEEKPQGPLSLTTKKKLADRGFEASPAVYAELDWKPHDRVDLTPGVRVDWFQGRDRAYAQPRLMARFLVAPSTKTYLKLGAGLFVQPPQAPYDNPVLGNPHVRPTQAVHFTVGVDTNPIKTWQALHLSVNLFYKDIRYVVVGSDGFVQRDGKVVPEIYSDQGVGRVYGGDFLLKHDSQKYVYGWIAYTLTRSERQDAPNAAWRPFQYDQTHIFTVVAGYHLPWDVDVGVRFRWVTGNPDTSLLANGLTIYNSDRDTYYPQPAAAFSSRLPDFIQLDLRIDKRFVFKSWIFAVYIDLSNVTNRGNVEAFSYSYDYTRRSTITGLPILPSLGLRASF